jgi:hypothetical protein
MAETTNLCKQCRSPLGDPKSCPCDCAPNEHQTYCHVCRVLYGVIYRSEYLAAHQREFEIARAALRARTGL